VKRVGPYIVCRPLLIVLALTVRAAVVSAHPLAPALLEIEESSDGRADVTWKTGALAVPGAPIRPRLPPSCRSISKPVTRQGTNEASVTTTWTVRCAGGLSGRTIAIEGLEAAGTQALVRVRLANGRHVQQVLAASEAAFTIPTPAGRLDLMRDYAASGVAAMLLEPDHLFFLLGLLLLAAAPRPLAWAVAGFAAGHSVTLTLAALGAAAVPTEPANLAIALSVLALALELSRRTSSATLMRRFPWAVAAAFGLVHGLGFAGALRGVGLPAGDAPLALGAFNLGLELGQLAFVMLGLALWFTLRRAAISFPRWAPQVPIYLMGSLGVFWSLQRAAGLF